MADAQLVVRPHLIAGGRQAIAELDVLDARSRKPLIEAAHGQEHITPNGAETGPERLRHLVRCLMDKRVREVLVLGYQVGRSRLFVIGAEQRRSLRRRLEQ
jgi:hypothetical protein